MVGQMSIDPVEATADPTAEDPVIREAQRRFQACLDWESNTRNLFIQDTKFCHADSDNGYQWPNSIRRNRDLDERPCLTINNTRQRVLQIINDAKKNQPAVKLVATGGGATKESADALMAVVRNIEYHSQAKTVYDTALSNAVIGGIGWIRVSTEYEDDNSFNQVIRFRRVRDSLTIFIDPDAEEVDKSDSRFAFIFDDIPLDEFKDANPNTWERLAPTSALDNTSWITKDHVRVAEYFRVVEDKDELLAFAGQVVRKSKMHKDTLARVIDDPMTKRRTLIDTKVEYYYIVGNEVQEKSIWQGKTIPLVPVIGEEVIIEGQLDRKGHVRALKDPQRMYNYWSSAGVEFGALQTKTPWIAPAEAIEGFEEYWRDANRSNAAILPYNGRTDTGDEIRPPQRIEPPVSAPAALQGMQIAMQEMMFVSGQGENTMGQQGNERTGRAIQERQRQGDTATYHYIDNLAIAIRRLGMICLDLIPKLYDVKRVIRCIAEDGKDFELTIDPAQEQAWVAHQNHNGEVALRSLNPGIGKYDVQADVGPAYATKREEAFNAFTLILTQSPELTAIIGDILMRAGDFPGAAEAAERLRRMVPKQALGEGPTQAEQELGAQLQNVQQLLSKTIQELAMERLKTKNHAAQKDIDVYKAYSDRLKILLDKTQDEAVLRHEIIKLVMETDAQGGLQPVVEDSEEDLARTGPQVQGPQQGTGITGEQAPVAGAMQRPNGEWTIPDPTRLGRDLVIGGTKQAPDGHHYVHRPHAGGMWQRVVRK